MLDPADSRLGAAGKPSPALRYRSRPATESALAVRGGVAPAVEPSAAGPAPRIPSTGVEAPVARVPAEASAAAVKGSLPRYAPPRAPHGSTYRPRPPDGELSARFYDRSSPSFALLQRPGDAMRGLPADTAGGVDWVQALQQEAIAPRASLAGADRMELLDSDVVMRDTASMPWVLFPHRRHTEWLACSNCHPAPFEPRSGANDIRMDDILRGRRCGQ